jgi:hypothetical protein
MDAACLRTHALTGEPHPDRDARHRSMFAIVGIAASQG